MLITRLGCLLKHSTNDTDNTREKSWDIIFCHILLTPAIYVSPVSLTPVNSVSPVSLTLVINIHLPISPQIFEKNRNSPNEILGGPRDNDSWKKPEVKISRVRHPLNTTPWEQTVELNHNTTETYCWTETQYHRNLLLNWNTTPQKLTVELKHNTTETYCWTGCTNFTKTGIFGLYKMTATTFSCTEFSLCWILQYSLLKENSLIGSRLHSLKSHVH